jgi:hypothetical protein
MPGRDKSVIYRQTAYSVSRSILSRRTLLFCEDIIAASLKGAILLVPSPTIFLFFSALLECIVDYPQSEIWSKLLTLLEKLVA